MTRKNKNEIKRLEHRPYYSKTRRLNRYKPFVLAESFKT